MERQYNTLGVFYITPTMTGAKGIIALEYADYEQLIMLGVMNEEVELLVEKVKCGIEYNQKKPSFRTKAGLYTIKMEGINEKAQLDIVETEIPKMTERGFLDGDEVALIIKPLPYHMHCDASYDSLDLLI